jgi:hypothetical protein
MKPIPLAQYGIWNQKLTKHYIAYGHPELIRSTIESDSPHKIEHHDGGVTYVISSIKSKMLRSQVVMPIRFPVYGILNRDQFGMFGSN